MSLDINEELPENLEWYQNQIAGHHPSVIRNNKRQIGIIKERGSDMILKLVQEGIRGQREILFYESLINENYCQSIYGDKSNLIVKLLKFIPKYFGRRIIKIENKKIEFLQLEDIINTYRFPCIMDIKIGKVTYDPNATEEKKLAESLKCACQKIFGFRVLGYQINYDNCKEPKGRDRVWGKSLTEDNIVQGFEEYLLSDNKLESLKIIKSFIEKIEEIKDWFERQDCLNFFASSLLFVYEGGKTLRNLDNPKVDVKMIDFSHVFNVDSCKDENYIHGLNYILKTFNQIVINNS